MHSYVVLLRGINVGGKNIVPMAELKRCLSDDGCKNVTTYIQSGNVLLQSTLSAARLGPAIETMLSKNFKLDSTLIRVLVLPVAQLRTVIAEKPLGFGESPETYHYDVIFLLGITVEAAMAVFNPREGVGQVWAGSSVVYSQRLSALRGKSRLSKVISTPAYKSMTIRNWNTTTKLFSLLQRYGT